MLIRRGSRCAEHARAFQARQNAKRFAGSGSGWKWEIIRRQVIRRDGGVCQQSDEGGCNGPLEVDHIVEIQHGGGDELENLRTLCRRHHARKRAATNV